MSGAVVPQEWWISSATRSGCAAEWVPVQSIDDAEQLKWRQIILALGYNVTPVLDRQYFNYFREPSGVLFEIATDQPGFAIDERPDTLGTALKLPAWLEPRRTEIERQLPPVNIPS